jgi:cupin superfamily protein
MRLVALPRIVENPDDFLAGWPRKPFLNVMDPAEVAKLLSVDEVDRMLVDNGLRYPSFGMEKSSFIAPDHRVTKKRFRTESDVGDTADLVSLAHHQQEGYSLSLHNVQAFSGRLGEFCDRLGYELGSPVTVTSFLSPPNARALTHHHDTVDLFVCQVEGQKTFKLYSPVVTDALDHQRWSWSYVTDEDRNRLVEGSPEDEYTLAPGHVLWIPRGWIHEAYSGDSVSLHVSLRVEAATEYWLANTIMHWLADRQGLRTNLPVAFSTTAGRCSAAAKDTVTRIIDLLATGDWDELVEHIQHQDRSRFLGPRIRPIRDILLGQMTDLDGHDVLLRAEGAVGRRWIGEVLEVHQGSVERVFSGAEARVLDQLLAEEPTGSIRDHVNRQLGDEHGEQLIRKLLASGLARIDKPIKQEL